ncbi:hypothetical protein [Paraburkholderia sp. J11-2]|uniref:hypothetical protein n=1 Tax=Paraburkholderia sp. J11-2 TaxID=2805431 RepID=UPI002AB73E1F|nr:hypothetical protein [Paraburkholderia sp. J11-2]
MTARILFVLLCLFTLASRASAQTVEQPAAPDSTSRQYLSPLQKNFGVATAPSRSDRANDLTRRCKEVAAEYDHAFRPAGTDQANAVVPNYGHYGEQENTMQRYNQRRDAEKEFDDLGCR